MGSKEVIDVPMFPGGWHAWIIISFFDPHFAATASGAGASRFSWIIQPASKTRALPQPVGHESWTFGPTQLPFTIVNIFMMS